MGGTNTTAAGLVPAGIGGSGMGLGAVLGRDGRRRSVLAGAVGNMLEWYDFAVYGYFSAVIGRHFFPSDDHGASLLAAFAVFAAAFFMRPLGGVLFGHVGDRYGRKAALVLSAGLMTVSTFVIGCLPTYETAGLLAPVLLVLLRLCQGLSVGGEYTASAIFLVEGAAPRRRGLVGSFAGVGASGGILIGSMTGLAVTGLMPAEAVEGWGWRIPFLLGIVLGAFIFVLRRHMEEPAPAAPAEEASPLVLALRTNGPEMLRGFALNLVFAAAFYVVFVYLVTYMHRAGGMAPQTAFTINTLAMVVLTLLIPVMGVLSDRIGRRRLLLAVAGGLALLSWPLFALVATGVPLLVLAGQIAFAVMVAGYSAAAPTALIEMFHHRSRCTALALSFNGAMALAGGTAPMIATLLVDRLHWSTGPGLLIAGLGLVSVAALLGMRDGTGRPLR